MEYQALYRQFRPETFDDVVGQEHIVRALSNQIESGKIAHAYLFCGTINPQRSGEGGSRQEGI